MTHWRIDVEYLKDCPYIPLKLLRLLKSGIMEPLRKRMDLQSERVNFCEGDEFDDEDLIPDIEEDGFCKIDSPKLRKMDRILEKPRSRT